MLSGLLERAKTDKRRAELEAELATPPLPVPARLTWNWYWRIRRRKGSSGFGPSPIEWPDIDAFARHARVTFTDWDLEIIEMLDDVYLSEHSKNSQQRKET
jgi:hypothetical protein